MKRRKAIALSIICIICVSGLSLIAWAPWITEEYAYSLVMDRLGGPDASFNYVGETMPVRDVPKTFVKLPFISLVYFPSEAMYIVTFFGYII